MAEGELLLDRFRLEGRLGEGGFASVYRAWDERLQRPVAVKVLDTDRAGERVMREAQAAARLNHRSIVTLYELGREGTRAYLVSELIDGRPLRVLVGDGQLSDRDVAVIGAELCDALDHAHERGVIHRDVKPENVLLASPEASGVLTGRRAFGRAMLSDFGVASVRGAESLTRTGEVVGTLAYMAPEQAEGCEVGPEADLYSLSLALYECWTGANPVKRSSPAQTARAIGAPVTPLAELRPELPPLLCETIDRCLEPEPGDRPPAWELRQTLLDQAPALDDARAIPMPESARESSPRVGLWRPLALLVAALATGVAAFAGLPGVAVILAALVLPLPVLLGRPREWFAPALAPLLGALGLAALFPALAGLAESPRRAASLGLWGFAWLLAAQAAAGTSMPLAGVSAASTGWEQSAAQAGSDLLAPILEPAMLVIAASWALAAASLAWILQTGGPALRGLGLLAWAALLVGVHRLLPGWDADPSTATAVALSVVLAAALWVRATPRRLGFQAASLPLRG